ncbi:hypothetical protein ACFV98_41470 [Streptomyces violascens]|uniref:hypothetical protein n=1 Tax=Streptomyces violascens TaxID=67381 RepID=UPI0036589C26
MPKIVDGQSQKHWPKGRGQSRRAARRRRATKLAAPSAVAPAPAAIMEGVVAGVVRGLGACRDAALGHNRGLRGVVREGGGLGYLGCVLSVRQVWQVAPGARA